MFEDFEFKRNDKSVVKLRLLKPTSKILKESEIEYRRVFADAVRQGVFLEKEMENILDQRDIWGSSKKKEHRELLESIAELETKLAKGGISKEEGKELAVTLKAKRSLLFLMLQERTVYDSNTAEGIAEQAKFDFLLSKCLINVDTGVQYFNSTEEYQDSTEVELGMIAATKFSAILYGYNDDLIKNLPENKFLRRFHFMDDELRMLDDKGEVANPTESTSEEEVTQILSVDTAEFFDPADKSSPAKPDKPATKRRGRKPSGV
jgi:hypothetical protein